MSFHLDADDTQMYLSFKHTDMKGIGSLLACLNYIRSSNFLHLNASKTEAIVFGASFPAEAPNKIASVLLALRCRKFDNLISFCNFLRGKKKTLLMLEICTHISNQL